MAETVTTPDVTTSIDQRFFLAPLGGPQHPITYLDRFPEEVYSKSLDSHLVKFMYALLGPAGVGWLRKNYLEARLLLEDYGMSTFDLDNFYGDPLKFGRILEEVYDEDPRALLPPDKWAEIQAKDAAYRNRALDYVQGARAGNTPQGIHLVARSGLGHECEIIEHYRWIYDQLTDDPLSLDRYGVTNSTEEFVVLPRRELPQDEIQVLTVTGSPTGGAITLYFPVGNVSTNSTAALAYNATRSTIQLALEAIPSIGTGNVLVNGGPLPNTPVEILFTNRLGFTDVPKLQVINSLTGNATPIATIVTKQSGVSQTDEIASISPRDQHYLRNALDYIKPVTSIVTFTNSSGLRTNTPWNSLTASNNYIEVVRYVTGQTGVPWPALDSDTHWIEAANEHRAPRTNDLRHHYHGFHNIANIIAYTDLALFDSDYLTTDWASAQTKYPNSHVGQFSNYQQLLFDALTIVKPDDFVYTADRATADYVEPLTITATSESSQLVNGIYPIDYSGLPGVPFIKYADDQFWSSIERTTGDDYLEIDLGEVQAINYLYFEITRKPCDIAVSYDLLDQAPARIWQDVVLDSNFSSSTRVDYDAASQNPWQIIELSLMNRLDAMIFTRFLRIKISRRSDTDSPFNSNGTLIPYSTEIRNLRIARNIS
jgi:hypothetical protein